ncbi:carotenoid oxygenase family protein [Actinacidiphila sp. DG2A-62]|uniref:carotenoid oxygenase family protein n=1 Tax=Actinacidiphila sp. DG2A-62 TaxID=3108821 RepID=UPI002DB7F0AB|nr:carotenoid oxygenase family protein [Actinacidiphila sp. DG2A-62]MEC3996372.1 carotenoid oxygenase family protein [Actinacidiphila sp. DG2A-62]
MLRGGAVAAAGGFAALRGGSAWAAGGGPAAGRAAAPGGGPAAATNRFPFLRGAFAPATEEVTAFDLPVTGRIPRELNGRYLRNGPNVLGLEDPRAHHWMLGQGMVHGVRLRDGRAEWYRNRWVRSSDVAAKLGEPYRGPVPDNDFAANTHVVPYKGRVLACQESGPMPYQLDEELNTVGAFDFGGSLKDAFTAHTKYDAEADELHAITYYPTWDHVRHLVVDHTGTVARTTRIPVADSPMMHDFALTERYVVVFDTPVTFDMAAAEAGAMVPYVWNDRHPSRVGVMPRAGGPVRWFEGDPSTYYSHTLNAYDDGRTVVVDFAGMPAPFFAAGRGSDGPTATGTPYLERWTIDLEHGRLRTRRIDDRPQEFPRVREGLVAHRHRYGYAACAGEMWRAYETVDGVPPDRNFGDALIKHDLLRGTTQVHRFPRNSPAGEAVFVPRDPDGDQWRPGHGPHGGADPRRGAEDDGYALAYVHNPDRGASDLVVLAAQDFTAPPLARVHLPGRVPLGFHGSWVRDV